MKLWQKEPNSVWYTDEKMTCQSCGKVKRRIYEIDRIGKFCWGCFCERLKIVGVEGRPIWVRMIISAKKGARV